MLGEVRGGWRIKDGEWERTDLNSLLFGSTDGTQEEFFPLEGDNGIIQTLMATKLPDISTQRRDQQPGRRITAEEVEALFGLERGHTAAPGLTPEQRFARLGEAVVVQVLEYALKPAIEAWKEQKLGELLGGGAEGGAAAGGKHRA